jgi:hypothetical protein
MHIETTPPRDGLRAVIFYDASGDDFAGFTDGTTWNGWANVWLGREEWERLLTVWSENANDDTAEYMAELRAQEPDADGLYSLACGYCNALNTTDDLTEQWQAWLSAQKLPQCSADELQFYAKLSDAQEAYRAQFSAMWDVVQAYEDDEADIERAIALRGE